MNSRDKDTLYTRSYTATKSKGHLARKSEVDELRKELGDLKKQMKTLLSDRGNGSKHRSRVTDSSSSTHAPIAHSSSNRPKNAETGSLTLVPTDRPTTVTSAAPTSTESKRVAELEAELRRQMSNNTRLENTVNQLQLENTELGQYKHDLTATLSFFQYHLGSGNMAATMPSRPGTLSIGDLKKKVKALNVRIIEAVAPMMKAVTFQNSNQDNDDGAHAYVAQTLGESIVSGLVQESYRVSNGDVVEPNHLLAQVAFLAFLTRFCVLCIQEWSYKNERFSSFLGHLYSDIQRSNIETPEKARFWRASAREAVRPNFTEPFYSESTIIGLVNIAKVASWSVPDLQQDSAFRGRLTLVFEGLQDLYSATMEQTVSADVYPWFVEHGLQFRGDCMKALVDTTPNSSAEELVVASVGMGLKKEVIIQGAQVSKSVLSPRVLLKRTLLNWSTSPHSQMCGKD